MDPTTRGRTGLLFLALGAVAALGAGCTAGAAGTDRAAPVAEPRSQLLVALDFEERATPLGGILPTVANRGVAAVRTTMVTTEGGRLRRDEGLGSGYSVVFPAFDGTTPQGAVLVLRAAGEPDVLAPGASGFGFGADVRLDAESEGSASDNGDNLVQRGFAAGATQFKLQVDHGVPSCRVAGADGVALVKGSEALATDRWYRLSCERQEDRLVLTWRDLEATDAVTGTASTTAPTGAVTFDPAVPLTVGGKVGPDGRAVRSETDQFNGAMDNVWFTVLGEEEGSPVSPDVP